MVEVGLGNASEWQLRGASRVSIKSSTTRPYIYAHVIGPYLLGMLLHKQRCLYPALYGLPSHIAKVSWEWSFESDSERGQGTCRTRITTARAFEQPPLVPWRMGTKTKHPRRDNIYARTISGLRAYADVACPLACEYRGRGVTSCIGGGLKQPARARTPE